MNDRGRRYVLIRFTPVAVLLMTVYFVANLGTATAAGTCTSPRATSPVYTGDKESGISQTNQTSWRVGILAITAKPNADIVVGFRAPTDQNWHDSKPISTKTANRILLKVGTGDVQFSTLYRASSGSSSCNNPPATTFSPNTETLSSIAPNTTQPSWPASTAATNPTPAPANPTPQASNGAANSPSTDAGTDAGGDSGDTSTN